MMDAIQIKLDEIKAYNFLKIAELIRCESQNDKSSTRTIVHLPELFNSWNRWRVFVNISNLWIEQNRLYRPCEFYISDKSFK